MVLRGQAVLDGAFNPNDKWRALTSKTFLSRIRAAIYLEQVDDFFAYSHREERAQALAIRWLISAARGRAETTMSARLSGELMDAANNRGNAVKKREDTHRMADANRAFSHYRW